MSYLSRALYEGDGSTNKFSVPFPYLSQNDVTLLVNNVSSPFIWLNATQIQTFGFTPAEGTSVLVVRNTTVSAAVVTYTNASVLTEDQLNRATLQNLYISQELYDLYNATLNGSLTKVATGNGIAVVDPTQLLQTITYDILDSELLADLQSRVTDINANAEGILGLTGDVSTLQDFQNLLGSVSDGVLTINTSTVQVSPGVSMAAQISGIEANVATNTAGIATEATARADGDSALASQINILVAGTATFYVQPTAPTSPNIGDVWYNSADNNHPYKWGGSPPSWIDVRDGAITDALASIATEQTVRASADTALANSISTLSSTVGTNTATLTSQGSSINGLKAEFTVKTDINGFVAGYGLAEYLNTDGSHTSDFIVLADQFGVTFPTIPWTAGMAVTAGQFVIPSVTSTGLIYQVTTGGVVGSAEPSWPITSGFTYTGDGAVSYVAVSPTSAAPFVVGSIGGTPGVGINGALVVNGTISATAIAANSITAAQIAASTITAAQLNVGTLSAISANMGTLTSGTIQTSTGAGARVEISSTGSFPLWYGSGTKTAANAAMYVDTAGDLFLAGTIKGSLMDLYSLRLDTGGGRRCPLMVNDRATWSHSSPANFNMFLGTFFNPNQGSGFNGTRVYSDVQDFFFDIMASTNGSAETLSLKVKYSGDPGWTTVDTLTIPAGYCLTWKPRYTTKTGSWVTVFFNITSSNGTCYNATCEVESYNWTISGNAPGSTSDNTGDSSVVWNPPSPPAGYSVP